MEPWKMGPQCSSVVMSSPQPILSESKSHSSLDKIWPPSKLWGHPSEITRQPHQRLRKYGKNQRFQQCTHQPSCSTQEYHLGS